MDGFITGLTSSLSANLLTTIILFVIAIFYAYTRGRRREQLLHFLGLSTVNRRLVICISSYSAYSVDPITKERLEKKIRSALSVNEFLAFPALDRWLSPLTKHSTLLEYLINYALPSIIRFMQINIEYLPSSFKDENCNQNNCTLILIGGPAFNKNTNLYYSQNMCAMQLLTLDKRIAVKIIKGKRSGDILGQDISFDEYETNGTKDIAVLEKVADKERNITVIIAAGATSQGTKAAIHYLISNWNRLYNDYNTNQFAICIECNNEKVDPDGFLDSTVLYEMGK